MKLLRGFLVLTFLALAASALAPAPARALTILRPFGGKVISIVVPGVICTQGEGIITIVAVGLSPITPYAVTLNTKRYLHGVIAPGAWIVGLYDPILNALICATDSIPPVPVPVFPIFIFGTSLPSL